MNRDKTIIRTSIFGILGNVLLVVIKMLVGLATGSIAVILDAVNNLSDALSSVITIIGTKLAGKEPDKKHPYGYGRIEYITSAIMAAIVLTAGFTSIKEAFDKVIHPVEVNYTVVSVIIIAVAVVIKVVMGLYVKATGKKVASNALVASGTEAMFDAVLSFSTLVAAAINIYFHISLEGWLSIILSAMIIKAGIELLMETLNSIIGTRAEEELTKELRAKVKSYEGVRGAYDIALHNYGPTQVIGSVHIEVADEMTAREIHSLTRTITYDVFESMGIILTIGIYSSNRVDDKLMEIKARMDAIVSSDKRILGAHGFFRDDKLITFDMVVDFDEDAQMVKEEIIERLSKEFEGYSFMIALDRDYSD